jgi:hypothetical protein
MNGYPLPNCWKNQSCLAIQSTAVNSLVPLGFGVANHGF